MVRTATVLLAGALLAGCELEVTTPRVALGGLPEGLEVEFTVDPAQVTRYESFNAHLHVTNTTASPIHVVTAHGCLVHLDVFRNGKRIPFQGSWWGCTAAITTHTFAPGETRSRSWELAAKLYAEHPGEWDGEPAQKGTYRVRVQFDTYSESSPGDKPFIERTLRVK